MIRWSLPLVLLLTGCPSQDGIVAGKETLWQHFPFDGNRTWEFRSDGEEPYLLVGTTREEDPDNELGGDLVNVYHVDFVKDCVIADPSCVDGEFVRTIAFSSDVANGTLIHLFEQGTASIDYDPPLVLAEKDVTVGQVTQTDTDGIKWTATMDGYQPCTDVVRMQGTDFERPNCAARLILEDSDTNPDTNYGLTGTYWVAKGIGFVGFQLEGEESVWGLASLDCEPDEECDGEW